MIEGEYRNIWLSVILFPVFLLALNSILQVGTRAVCKQIWKFKQEMALETEKKGKN